MAHLDKNDIKRERPSQHIAGNYDDKLGVGGLERNSQPKPQVQSPTYDVYVKNFATRPQARSVLAASLAVNDTSIAAGKHSLRSWRFCLPPRAIGLE